MKRVYIASLLMVPMIAHAQVWTAITGHITDARSRFTADQTVEGTVVRQGMINIKAPGQDPIHNSRGTVKIIKSGNDYYLQLDRDFYSSPGPDYHIYVSSARGINDNPDVHGLMKVNDFREVARLSKGSGASYYRLTGINGINSVTIWCKQFGEYIGSADVK